MGRVGVAMPDIDITNDLPPDSVFTRYLNQKFYELTDHLGHVRAVLGDRKRTATPNAGNYYPEIRSYSHPYPFGMPQPGRTWDSADYRYGYNGMESDPEVKQGAGKHYTTYFRQYDPRLGRWWSNDPVTQLGESPYAAMFNNPIAFSDPFGNDPGGGRKEVIIVEGDDADYVTVIWHVGHEEYQRIRDRQEELARLRRERREADNLHWVYEQKRKGTEALRQTLTEQRESRNYDDASVFNPIGWLTEDLIQLGLSSAASPEEAAFVLRNCVDCDWVPYVSTAKAALDIWDNGLTLENGFSFGADLVPVLGKAFTALKYADEFLEHADEGWKGLKHGEDVTGPSKKELAELSEAKKADGPLGVCFTAGTMVATSNGFVDIASLKIGDRVVTTDSIGQRSYTSVNPLTWRTIKLRMPNPEYPTDTLDLVLLRPVEWVTSVGAVEGGSIEMVLEEMGLYGPADIIDISECAPIAEGAGRVVLATVTHRNAYIHRLTFDNSNVVLEPTDRHRLYSVTRHAWVPADQLHPGEILRTRHGGIRIRSNERLPGEQRVYNIQVETEECYYVSTELILSHNTNPCGKKEVQNSGNSTVYLSKTEEGVTQYVGITNNLARRAAEHLKTKGIEIEALMRGLSRSDARAVEQALIEIHGLMKDGGTLLNRINSISKTNPSYAAQIKRGYQLLKNNGYHE